MTTRTTITFIFVAVLARCTTDRVDSNAEGQKLMQISREWSKAAATGNVDTTLSYWADDAVVMSPGQPPIKGTNAIRKMLESTSEIPGFQD